MASSSRVSLLLSVLGALALAPACSGDAPKPPVTSPVTAGKEAAPAVAVTPPAACNADSAWITSTTPPTEIGNGVPLADETNCQFQQFAWQWFLYLVQPSATAAGERNFESWPVFQAGTQNQCASPAPTGKAAGAKALFLRTRKVADDSVEGVLPTEQLQATSQVLYDQGGTIVLYNVRYSPNECQATTAGFQANTVELKTSWRILPKADPTYYTMNAEVAGFTGEQILGLVGFHLVINTKNHPEFVWATFEHEGNAPDCTNPQAAPASGWAFTSAAAAACLQNGGLSACSQYNFNNAPEIPPGQTVPVTGTPNEVCGVYPDGTDPEASTGGNNNDTNRFNVDMLNTQLVGPSGYLAQLPASDPMAVWQNYFLGGSLWTNGGVGSTESSPGTVQRGSLEVANLTMETFFQADAQNCFTCHTYTPEGGGYDPGVSLCVSHIACDLLADGTCPYEECQSVPSSPAPAPAK